MTAHTYTSPTVIRTERGLSVAGTRITLYSIMDCIKDNWPANLIRDRFNLTDTQISDVMTYIQTHRAEVEAEYELVLKQAEQHRQYWEQRNKEKLEQIRKNGPPKGKEELWAKAQEKKKKLVGSVKPRSLGTLKGHAQHHISEDFSISDEELLKS